MLGSVMNTEEILQRKIDLLTEYLVIESTQITINPSSESA
jgi:hypothetical protein